MDEKDYKRAALRAPLHTQVLISNGSIVLKTNMVNVSKEGMLVKSFPGGELQKTFSFMIDVPHLKNYKTIAAEKLMTLNPKDLSRNIFRIKGTVKRDFKGLSPIELTRVEELGIQFEKMDNLLRTVLEKYVETFKDNVLFLLEEIEKLGGHASNQELTKQLALLLGYDWDHKTSILRHKVFHHYQSMIN